VSRAAADDVSPADSYYGRPIINPPVWEEREIAGYLFCGGLAGASSILATVADVSGRPHLAGRARLCASAAVTVSFAALIKDLGRPERFVNMLRVFKPTSPMSVGTWILSAYAPLNYLASATTVARRAPLLGRAAGVGAGLLGSAVASYTAALIADTAVPTWHEGYRELPFLFVGSAAAAAGGFGLLAAPVVENAPAARMALVGSAGELIAERLLERRLGPIAETLHGGVAGRRMRAAKLLSAGGLLASLMGVRRSRIGAALTGAALLAGSALTRFGVFAAGMESARDPRYTVQLHRARAEAKVTLDVYPAADRASKTR
jgi:formate-dependent nitrite reductase membrane component NrfD